MTPLTRELKNIMYGESSLLAFITVEDGQWGAPVTLAQVKARADRIIEERGKSFPVAMALKKVCEEIEKTMENSIAQLERVEKEVVKM